MPSRYQRGSVRLLGKTKIWFGMYREDINIDGKLQRKQKQVRLGTLAEIPTKNAARNKLSEFLNTTPVMGMFFRDLVKRWQDAEGPVLKTTTFAHYNNALTGVCITGFWWARNRLH